MKTVNARVLDQTHLELIEPIPVQSGELIQISIREDGEEDRLWHERAKRHFLKAYDDGDSIYDEI